MPYFTYVIYSKRSGRYYKGHCKDLDARLKEHNAGKTKSLSHLFPGKLSISKNSKRGKRLFYRKNILNQLPGVGT
jgi:predicted GIY-YIG superfamily endonuclease